MIKVSCMKCNAPFGIQAEGELKDYEGSTLDCPECSTTMIIEEGKLENFNEYLKESYKEAGANIDENKDYTKSYIEI